MDEAPLNIHGISWKLALSAAGVWVALVSSSCLYDADQRCGPREHLGSLGSCLCDDQFVLQDHGCVPCGDNETWQNGVCVCSAGYARATDGAACTLSGAGLACDPSTPASCTDPNFALCRAANGGGYCTKDCAADTDCPHGFACDTTASPATCKTAAVGQGDACTSDSDCAGKDATYCEVLQSHVCLVQGCSTGDPSSCSEGWTCCDLHSLGLAKTLCVPEGKCLTQ